MPRRALVAMAVVALVATTAMSGHAARLNGLISKQLTAYAIAGQDAVPTVLVNDTFDSGVDNLNGQLSDSGQPWSVVVGSLSQSTDNLRCTSCSGANYGVGLIDADRANGTLTADVTPNSAGPTGVLLNADTALAHVVVVWVSGNSLELSTYANNTLTLRRSAAISGSVSGVTRQLKVVATGGTYTVSYLNGAAVVGSLTFTLTASEIPVYTANTMAGVVFYSENNLSRIDNFKVVK
jgi:hypothetical protein